MRGLLRRLRENRHDAKVSKWLSEPLGRCPICGAGLEQTDLHEWDCPTMCGQFRAW